MANNNYKRGRRLEYSVKDNLERLGYVTVRAAGSKGPADIIAMDSSRKYFIQCKISGYIGVEEWNEIMRYARKVCAIPIMATREEGKRGVKYFRMMRDKDGTKKRQPLEPFEFGKAVTQ